jgi:ATP-binding cassette subfamily C protein
MNISKIINKTKDDKKRMERRNFRHAKAVIKTLFSVMIKEKPILLVIYFFRVISLAVQPILPLLIQAPLIDELLKLKNADLNKVTQLGIAFLLCASLPWIFIHVLEQCKSYYGTFFELHFERELAKKGMNMDFQLTEDPEALGKAAKGREGITYLTGGVVGILNNVEQLCANFLIIISVIVIVITGTPLLLIVQAISLVIMFFLNSKMNIIHAERQLMMAKINRGFGYFFWHIADYDHAKDIRLYNAADIMIEKCNEFNQEICDSYREEEKQKYPYGCASDVVNGIRDGLCYLYVGYIAFRKLISVGDFTMYVGTIHSFMDAVTNSVYFIQEMLNRCAYAYDYIEFMQFSTPDERGGENVFETANGVIKTPEIEFKNVSFKYPRAKNFTLKNVNIIIPAGQRLSIVGLNGAGKTTFIKLLCRLYDVTEGEILIDSKNINSFSESEYRKLISVVFQDFATFAFSLKENVSLSEKASDEDVLIALEKAGFSREEAEKIGLEVPIEKSFDKEATDLSGGQKQKAALARALFRNSPVVVLDEPTAALDPIAEYDIYKKFNALVDGKNALYISHRLSSCKFCEKIAVFADNTISEYGTHDELVEQGGVYATMWTAQAQYYVKI